MLRTTKFVGCGNIDKDDEEGDDENDEEANLLGTLILEQMRNATDAGDGSETDGSDRAPPTRLSLKHLKAKSTLERIDKMRIVNQVSRSPMT